MYDDYLSHAGDLLASMRLLVEGACYLFEEEAQPLFHMGIKNDIPMASVAFDTIGVALRRLQTQVRELQDAHTAEVIRQKDERA